MPYKDPERQKEWQRGWEKRNLNIRRKYRKEVKIKAYQKLGGKCVYCGCNNFDALEINHKFGGGAQEIKTRISNYKFYLDIVAGRRTTEDLELTCRVCNAWHYLTKIKKIAGNWRIEWIE